MKLTTITTDEEFVDPYDHMTDDEFADFVDGLVAKKAVSITIRVEPTLLADVKTIAGELRVPYQTLMKEWVSQSAAAFRKRQTKGARQAKGQHPR